MGTTFESQIAAVPFQDRHISRPGSSVELLHTGDADGTISSVALHHEAIAGPLHRQCGENEKYPVGRYRRFLFKNRQNQRSRSATTRESYRPKIRYGGRW